MGIHQGHVPVFQIGLEIRISPGCGADIFRIGVLVISMASITGHDRVNTFCPHIFNICNYSAKEIMLLTTYFRKAWPVFSVPASQAVCSRSVQLYFN